MKSRLFIMMASRLFIMLICPIFFIFIGLSDLLAQSTQKNKSHVGRIAVLHLKNQAKLTEDEILYLTSQIQEWVQVKTKNQYQVITQENISVLQSSDQTLENCIESACEIDIGQKLGAYLLITGALIRFGNQTQIKCILNLHETESRKMLSIQTIKAKHIDELEKKLPTFVNQLIDEAFSYDHVQANLKMMRIQKRFKDLGIEMDMVWLKESLFDMGGEGYQSSKPMRNVQVRHFLIGKTEVTNQQYLKCVDAGVCTLPHWEDTSCLVWKDPYLRHGVLAKSFRGDHQPVVCVDWAQARTFSQWVGGDLPSEAQWEYASRSRGESVVYTWGTESPTCEYAVMFDRSRGCGVPQTANVCSKPLGNSKQGVCDLLGNVAEWVLDEWHTSYEGARMDDLPWCKDQHCSNPPHIHRSFRGGSWGNQALMLNTRVRNHIPTNYRAADVGFRVVIRAE